MSRLPKSKFVMLGIRLAATAVIGWIVIHDFRNHGPRGWEDLGLLVVGLLLGLSNWRGIVLAKQNMKKFGLEPDRDEALPACKAIDI